MKNKNVYILPAAAAVCIIIILIIMHSGGGRLNTLYPGENSEPVNSASASAELDKKQSSPPTPTQNKSEAAPEHTTQNNEQESVQSTQNKTSEDASSIPPFRIANKRSLTPRNGYIHPRWSPDGLDVLFTKAKYRGLYLVSSNGSDIITLSDEFGIGYNVRWSLDGTKLIVMKDGEETVIDLAGMEEVDPEDVDYDKSPVFSREDNIVLRDPESGEEKNLTSGEDSYYNPALSPDAESVVYEGLTTGINVKNLETGEVVNIGQGNNPQWTPDGEGVIYGFTQDDGENILGGDIYYASSDGDEIYNLTSTPDIIELNPSISPDGTQIIYEVDGQIIVADIEDILR